MFTLNFNAGVLKSRRREQGMALLMVLLILLIVTAVGLGLLAMSDTESMVNGNYKDTQIAFFAMRSGLEEVRDRVRTSAPSALTSNLPVAMPPAANSILYIINSAGVSDTVDPANTGSQYFDDEFCHEAFAGDGVSNAGAGVPCPHNVSSAPPAGSYTYVNSTSPGTGTAAALKYKWVRITLKQNATISNATVDSGQPAATQVCYQTINNQEIPLTLIPGGYTSCSAAQNAGLDASPVYIVTSMAITPQGSRRIGQYEIAGYTIRPPGAAVALDGPGATFNPAPHSNNFGVSGNDSGTASYAGPAGSCTVAPGPAQVPAISTGDAAGVANIGPPGGSIPNNRYNNYTGTPPPTPAPVTPSVVNEGSTGGGQLSGTWSSPAALNQLVNEFANVADNTYGPCTMNGQAYQGATAACSPSGSLGTNTTPQITFVNGDFNYGGASGAGVLIVTGNLSMSGAPHFNGLILVIGQGNISVAGGGSGQFNGTMFAAQTNSPNPPFSQLASLGSPTWSWNGGGTNFFQYNSCWANIGNSLEYNVLATREEMY